jgi:heat shock protein HslJ
MRPRQRHFRLAFCSIALALIAGCATAGADHDSPMPAQSTSHTAPTPEPTGDSARFEFAGTAWRLVEILSMDDSVFTPSDRSHYTLAFAADGSATLRADCNRGTGTWSSQGPNQLQFGPIASTRAMCPPGSLSARYLAQFEWVRSYVTRDGHLFLATMADGAIIEFEPVTEP